MHHLKPNPFLHITNFITVYECYLGIAPHFELFRCNFQIKVQKNGDDICDLGGMNLQLRPSTKFFKIPLLRSVREWHKG